MTDFHSHLLPGVDDGSDSTETSLLMLEMWREQGIERICATPHFYAEHNTPERFFANRQAAYEELAEAMKIYGIDIPILLGAEVRFFDGISGVDDLYRFCLEGTNLLLLEMPFTRWTDRMMREVADISSGNVIPVAAHLERYMDFNPKKTIRQFMDLGIMIQCNAEFFLSRRTSRTAMRMLKEGRIHFLGSDAHNTRSRQPNLGPALDLIEQKLGAQALINLARSEEFLS